MGSEKLNVLWFILDLLHPSSMRLMSVMMFGMMLLHLVICPYTKVEESFNLQAMHDIINHGFRNLQEYDHLVFPGVVPRSFLGPLLISALTYPCVMLGNLFCLSKLAQQYLVRGVLGVVVAFAFLSYCRAVKVRYGVSVMRWLFLLTLTQFHFIFYLSRPLPNTFALAIVMLALSYWLRQRHELFVWTAGAAVIVFRFETLIFLGFFVLSDMLQSRSVLLRLIKHAILAAVFWLGLTVLVDSYFWNRWLWPEGEVLWFNIYLNKSSEWGTSPFLWYFYSALPRALLGAVVLIPWSYVISTPALMLSWPALAYVLLYSFLPHKELRFIIYTIPIFNTAAACAAASLWRNQGKSTLRKLLSLGVFGLLIVNAVATCLFLDVSHLNYPGGNAMAVLHELEQHRNDVNVHIDVYTAQTGVSRFTQLRDSWIYNKTEDLPPGGQDIMSFSHLMIGALSESHSELTPYQATHSVLHKTCVYAGFGFAKDTFPFLKIRTKETVWILKKIDRSNDFLDVKDD